MSENNKIDNALQRLLGLSLEVEKIWQNASPASEFAAQKIAVSWSKYDFLIVPIRHYTTAELTSVNVVKTSNTFRSGFLNSKLPQMNAYLYLYGRSYELEDDGIRFLAGYSHDTNSTVPTEGGKYAIPLTIYGMKILGGGA